MTRRCRTSSRRPFSSGTPSGTTIADRISSARRIARSCGPCAARSSRSSGLTSNTRSATPVRITRPERRLRVDVACFELRQAGDERTPGRGHGARSRPDRGRAVRRRRIDRAPVREFRHGEVGKVLKYLLEVERRRQHAARFRTRHPHVHLGRLDGRQVLNHRHGCDHVPVGVRQGGGGLQQLPSPLAGAPVDGPHQERFGLLAPKQPDRRDIAHRQRLSMLVVDDVIGHDRVKRVALEFLERVEPEMLDRRAIGVDQVVLRITDRDRFAECLQQRGELWSAAAQDLLPECSSAGQVSLR